MEFDWSPEEEAFRQEVRKFLAEELTDEVRGSMFIDTPARFCGTSPGFCCRSCNAS